MQLNASQRQAVEAVHGPCLVLAGAGSGKTRVITAKLISLIRDHGLKPARLCALTFTNKAASEMAARVGAQLGAERAAEVRICTFHALGRYFLSQEHRAAGLGARFSLFDEGDTLKALAWLIRERFPQLLLPLFFQYRHCLLMSPIIPDYHGHGKSM